MSCFGGAELVAGNTGLWELWDPLTFYESWLPGHASLGVRIQTWKGALETFFVVPPHFMFFNWSFTFADLAEGVQDSSLFWLHFCFLDPPDMSTGRCLCALLVLLRSREVRWLRRVTQLAGNNRISECWCIWGLDVGLIWSAPCRCSPGPGTWVTDTWKWYSIVWIVFCFPALENVDSSFWLRSMISDCLSTEISNCSQETRVWVPRSAWLLPLKV